MKHAALFILFALFGVLPACSPPAQPAPEPPAPEPYFKPGEYGGSELPGTEYLTWIDPSPDGQRLAVIRRQSPDQIFDPRYQLWVMNADGSEPRMIAYSVRNVAWNPDGRRLAFTFNPVATAYTYVFTLDLPTGELKLWNSRPEHYFYSYTTGTTGWLADGRRLLVAVNGKAYKQEYPRGTYILDTADSSVVGPFKELHQASYLGNNDTWIVGKQYSTDTLSGNRALYKVDTGEFKWLTTYHDADDSLLMYTGIPLPSPTGPQIVLPRFVENAWQLFLIDEDGRNLAQLTTLGADKEVMWPRSGEYLLFNRDTHKAPGARYVPFKYYLRTGEEEPLWPDLPDSVPVFPEFSTQTPLNLFNHIP